MPKRPPGKPRRDQRWPTFLRNHAKAIVACDFFVAVTATSRLLYVFIVIGTLFCFVFVLVVLIIMMMPS